MIRHRQQGFQAAQIAIRPPILRQINAGPFQLIREAFQLGFQPFQQGEGIGRGAGEARQHLAAGNPANFARIALHHCLAERDLAIPGHGHLPALADAKNGGAVPAQGVVLCLCHGCRNGATGARRQPHPRFRLHPPCAGA